MGFWCSQNDPIRKAVVLRGLPCSFFIFHQWAEEDLVALEVTETLLALNPHRTDIEHRFP